MKLTPLSFSARTRVNLSTTDTLRCDAFAGQVNDKKRWFPERKLTERKLTGSLGSGFSIIAGLTFVIFFCGTVDTALAADGPKAGSPKTGQDQSFDVPGSFKDLPDAKDAATAKRLPEQITLPASSDNKLNPLVIDAEKAVGTATSSSVTSSSIPRMTPSASDNSAIDNYADGDLVDFHATAYCLKGRTASGMDTRPGMIAADPRVLPLGTVVHLRAGRYTGTYTVMDTGGRIRGNIVDVYVPTYREAIEFGRRQVKIKVLGRTSSKTPSKTRRDAKSLLASER